MNNFSDFGIKAPQDSFVGNSISMARVLNRKIKVHKYVIEPTKFDDAPSPVRLKLQITIGEKKHIIWTGSKYLMDMIKKAPKDRFPFNTTIIQDGKSYIFT